MQSWFKWTLIIGVLCLLAVAALRAYYIYRVNPRVVEELRNDPDGERARQVMLLTFPDGRAFPVNYLHEGNEVFVGADGRWWRAFRDGNVPVKALIRGRELSGRARTVMDDREYTRAVFERLRPNVPDWLPEWLDAYLVVIELDD